MQPIDLSPSTRAEIRSELAKENVPPEVREKIEQALGGKPVSPEKRAALQEQLKNESLPKEARDAIQQRLEYGDPAPLNARAKLEDTLKDLPPQVRTKVEESFKKAQNKAVIFEADKEEKPNDMPKWLEKRAREKFGEHGTNIQLFLVTLMSNLPYMMLAASHSSHVCSSFSTYGTVFSTSTISYTRFTSTPLPTVGIILIGSQPSDSFARVPGPVAGWIIAVIWIVFLVQIVLSIRRVYRQGWFISIFKFLFGGLVYLPVLVAAVAATFFITLIT